MGGRIGHGDPVGDTNGLRDGRIRGGGEKDEGGGENVHGNTDSAGW
jgi:hypothetical protein